MDLAADLDARSSSLADTFAGAAPFPHVVIDGFLDDARALLGEFPSWERGNNLNENGTAGGKSVFEDVRTLGPAFRALDDLFASRRFLGFLQRITGISGLIYDPAYIGGGTHENRAGQELDPHVDFNHHPTQPWQRRVNLLLYLNDEWQKDWGGSLELHADPWAGGAPAATVLPLFNRCVLFATSERSWHGFTAIAGPPSIARRSIAAYFYVAASAERQAAHSTIYVERKLPPELAPGTRASVARDWLDDRIARRCAHLQRLRAREDAMLDEEWERLRESLRGPLTDEQLAAARALLDGYDRQLRGHYDREPSLRAALGALDTVTLGAALADGLTLAAPVEGVWHDRWVAARARIQLASPRAVVLRGRVPGETARQRLLATADGVELPERMLAPGSFEWSLPSASVLEIRAAETWNPLRAGRSTDGRDLAWLLDAIDAV
jgi:hypothetical protein